MQYVSVKPLPGEDIAEAERAARRAFIEAHGTEPARITHEDGAAVAWGEDTGQG